jgi:hypothetical protein
MFLRNIEMPLIHLEAAEIDQHACRLAAGRHAPLQKRPLIFPIKRPERSPCPEENEPESEDGGESGEENSQAG